MRRQWIVIVLLSSLLGGGRPTAAQVGPVPVIDAANLAQNIAQWIETVAIVANQILELTPVDEIILSGEFTETLDTMTVIIAESIGLGYDLQSLQAQIDVLFNLDTAPDNMTDLKLRLREIRRVAYDCHVYAMRAQTLLRTTLSAIGHLTRLVDAIGSFIGNMQGNQTVAQLNGSLVEILAKLQIQTVAYDRSQSVEHITDVMTQESLHRIQEQLMADHPSR
jgi:conjugal transfer/entry exclusion protein